ncbi:hypothetical protein AB0H83_37555 [Dactylosporangium sp. NPDC050688]|uniref:hypothetical protein n=1 Tax=Dactylosporangium sp. NPDC050688 TaxID=3157217 RepID=UPI0033DD14A0
MSSRRINRLPEASLRYRVIFEPSVTLARLPSASHSRFWVLPPTTRWVVLPAASYWYDVKVLPSTLVLLSRCPVVP